MKTPKLSSRLLGRAVAVFLGVAGVSLLVLALSLVFKRGLDQVHGQMRALNAEGSNLQRAFLLVDHLTHELSISPRDDGPDAAAIVDSPARLEDLVKVGWEALDSHTSADRSEIRETLIELEGILAEPLSAEHADILVARVIPTLGRFRTEVENALKQLQKTRVQLALEEERRADLGALAMLCVGFIGFAIVCLLTGRFFLNLSRDVGRLKDRANRIAEGDYGQPLEFERKDEVGELAQNINTMAQALAEREREAESVRRCLCQSEKMSALGTFAAGIAHEIGNPIQSISALCEMLGDSLAGDPGGRSAAEGRKHLQMIVEQVDRMSYALRDLRDFAGPAPAEMGSVSVNSALESAIQLLRFDPRFRNIRLTADLRRDVPLVYGAAGQLSQVALNVLINAADAIDGGGGAIAVTTAPDQDGALITIEDNGRGMSKEACEKALDAFFTTKAQGMGIGLGLTVCKAIVEQHHGTIALDSEAGRGTRVCIRIPSRPQEGDP